MGSEPVIVKICFLRGRMRASAKFHSYFSSSICGLLERPLTTQTSCISLVWCVCARGCRFVTSYGEDWGRGEGVPLFFRFKNIKWKYFQLFFSCGNISDNVIYAIKRESRAQECVCVVVVCVFKSKQWMPSLFLIYSIHIKVIYIYKNIFYINSLLLFFPLLFDLIVVSV